MSLAIILSVIKLLSLNGKSESHTNGYRHIVALRPMQWLHYLNGIRLEWHKPQFNSIQSDPYLAIWHLPFSLLLIWFAVLVACDERHCESQVQYTAATNLWYGEPYLVLNCDERVQRHLRHVIPSIWAIAV